MKNGRKGYLSAKIRKTPNNPFNQKESNDINNNKLYKRSKYYNLSLNINNNNKEKIYGLESPKYKYNNTSNKFLRSFSTQKLSSFSKKNKYGSLSSKNIFSTNYGESIKSAFPAVLTHKGLVKSPSSINYHIYNSRFFKIDDEKLSQEIYYLKNDIHKMNKKLFLLGIENKEKDIILTEKENEINSIINKNSLNCSIDENFKFENNYNNINTNEEYNQDKDNKFNLNVIFNNITLNNYNYNNLFIRIRHQIIKAFKEIKKLEEEIRKKKKSIYYTKMKEIELESFLYQQQINKINAIIEKALSIYERNKIEINEYELLKNKIKEQERVLNDIDIEYQYLQKEEMLIYQEIEKIKKNLCNKNNKKIKNYNLLNNLNKKNDILSKDKIILMQYNNKEKTKKIKDLKKNIELFKLHYKHTSNDLNQLKEKREKLLKEKKINPNQVLPKKGNYLLKNTQFNYSNKLNLNKKVEELSIEYDKKKQYEKLLEEEMKKYESKFNQIINNINEEENINLNNDINNENNINNENEDENNENNENNEKIENNKNIDKKNNEEDLDNIINFGINKDNPFYSEDELNIPEKTNKFNNTQFGNFAYILFKNFESKNILLNDSQNKIINPFLKIISEKNIKNIRYNNDSFNIIINELTNIMMKALENTNKKNMKLISIFIGALLHNSNYDINQLVNCINVLFSYTNNYSTDEELYTYKLQTKYKDKLTLLYNKLYEYIKNNISTYESNNYISLLKVKEIIENNNIQLKDKYLEFLYYYLKKFNDPNSNLEDLDFDLLNNLFLLNYKNNSNNVTNSNDNDSVTEITNEEYEKQLKDAINIIKDGINDNDLNFDDLVKNITYKAEIDGVFYDYFTIENFNEELKRNKIILSELKLSCLCNKYCLPENLKFIDKNKIEKDIIE